MFNCLFLICFFSLTLSDARTVSIIMRGTWSGATPLFIMVLLRLAWGQEVPLIPGKTWHVSQHVLVSSSVIKTSWSASIVMVCLCLSVSQQLSDLLYAWHRSCSFSDLLLTWDLNPESFGAKITFFLPTFFWHKVIFLVTFFTTSKSVCSSKPQVICTTVPDSLKGTCTCGIFRKVPDFPNNKIKKYTTL